jgi:hypothetical protein
MSFSVPGYSMDSRDRAEALQARDKYMMEHIKNQVKFNHAQKIEK